MADQNNFSPRVSYDMRKPIMVIPIFDPYDMDSNSLVHIPESKKVATIPNLLIRSTGSFGDNWGNPCTDSIYVYEIAADIAALQVQIPLYSSNNDSIAVGLYDKSLKEIYLDKDETSRVSMAYRTSYLMWNFGSITRKEMHELKEMHEDKRIERKDWIVVPREIFKDIDDYVYLCICTERSQGEPVVKMANFPKDRPFFYDKPVATSIYKYQTVGDSKILFGHVMEFKNGTYTTLKGQYDWADNAISYIDGLTWDQSGIPFVRYNPYDTLYDTDQFGPTVNILTREDLLFLCSDNNLIYLCPKIDVYMYMQPPEERAKDITAFVWQSGNDDDEVKKSYIKKGEEIPNNTYSHVMDSLSSQTIYGSMVSLTKLTTENAAKYVVRALAKQPEGFRCFSIDNNSLCFLMGGAIFKIEFILINAFYENKIKDLYNPYSNDNDVVSIVNDLFAVNGSHLFFDTNVTYKHDIQENVKFYMQNVLGIEEGSNGCKKIKTLLNDLFDQIAKLGLSLDYVYSDIEGPWNDARLLLSRRFRDDYFKKKAENLNSFYNGTLSNELKARNEIWDEMQRRGFVSFTDELSDMCSANDTSTSRHSFYGLNAETYPRRRNINIWDAVMKGYENKMFDEYIMAPVREHHPKVKFSVFEHGNAKGYVNYALRFETYLGGTILQNSNIYSSGAMYGDTPEEYYKKRSMDNWKMFPNKRNYFSFFVGYINKLRSLLVSTQSEEYENGKFNVFFGSYNMWINDYLQSVVTEETLQLVNQLKDENDKTFHSLEAYYNEFMYHLFLCCPDKAIAYFQVEKTYIKNKGTTDNGGTYYFPYGDVNDNYKACYEEYYTDSYRRLQTVLAELNGLIGHNEYKTMVNTLASENEPYVITSIEFKDKKLWRLTLNDPIVTQGEGNRIVIAYKQGALPDITFLGQKQWRKPTLVKKQPFNFDINMSNGRIISFTNAKNVIVGEYGMWIETPLSDEPKFTAIRKYYENNPAYSSHIDYAGLKYKEITSDYFKKNLNTTLMLEEFVNVNKDLIFIHPASHTIFGESPKYITSSILFSLSTKNENNTEINIENHTENNREKLTDNLVYLFYNSLELFYPVIRKLDNSTGGYDFSTWYQKSIDNKTKEFCKKVQLTTGIDYELVKHVALNTKACDEIWSGRIRYELWMFGQNGDKSLVFSDERDISIYNPNQEQYYQQLIDIAQFDSKFNWDDITIHEFNMYFTQQHEKLELFRKSDGVNIGRVNKQVKAYADLPVETKWNDKLLGKLSWLNATDQPVTYTITINRIGNRRGLINQQIKTINVDANSEGYVMIPLPALNESIRRVELTCEKPMKNILRCKMNDTYFFVNHYNKNRKQTISVDISD